MRLAQKILFVARWCFADGMRSDRELKMKKPSVQTLLQAAACLLCAAVAAAYSDRAYTEFGGGALSGPLLKMNTSGGVLFLAALILTFIYRRIAAMCALVASLLCLPLYLFLVTPRPFYWIFPFETLRRRPPPSFVWNDWALAGILLLAVLAYLCIRTFSAACLKSVRGV
jgi:hypothetical protein